MFLVSFSLSRHTYTRESSNAYMYLHMSAKWQFSQSIFQFFIHLILRTRIGNILHICGFFNMYTCNFISFTHPATIYIFVPNGLLNKKYCIETHIMVVFSLNARHECEQCLNIYNRAVLYMHHIHVRCESSVCGF